MTFYPTTCTVCKRKWYADLYSGPELHEYNDALVCDECVYAIVEGVLKSSDAIGILDHAAQEARGQPYDDGLAWLKTNRPKELARILAEEPRVLPSPDALYGSDPDFTGGVESVEYLHQMRARRSGETP